MSEEIPITEAFEQQFPEVVRMTEQQKIQEFQIFKSRLVEKIEMISHNDCELIEMLDAVVAATIWLKEKHDKEGRLIVEYTKKKNVRGEAEAHVVVKGKYSQKRSETTQETIIEEFLSKNFMIDAGVENTLLPQDMAQ